MINVRNSSRGRSQGYPKIFRAPMETYRAHCAVIFAIAQLSCLHLYLLFYSRLSCKRITVMLYSNFQIFRYLGNGFWSETNYIAQLRSLTPEQPLCYLVKYLLYKTSYGKFSVKIFKFSLPWQHMQSLTDSIKLTDPINPLVGASIWGYQLYKLSYSRFYVENCKFLLPWQQGFVRAKCDWHSWIGRPRKPYHRTKNYDYLICNWSYGKFSGKIPNFSLPWQQGLSEQSLADTIKLAETENPLVGASIWGVSPAQADFVLKIANFRCHGNKGLSEPNVTGIVELADPENHTIEPKITTIFYITGVMSV